MGVIEKHRYRTGFLKSEKWKDVRWEVLAKCRAKCAVCGFSDFRNDVHHVRYPSNIYDTKASDCICLCRECHDAIHKLINGPMTDGKTRLAIKFIKNYYSSLSGIRKINKSHRCTLCGKSCRERISREMLPKNPNRNSVWSICEECNLSMPVDGFESFVEARQFMKRVKPEVKILRKQGLGKLYIDNYEI